MDKGTTRQAKSEHDHMTNNSLKYVSLLVLVLQNACQVLLIRHSRTRVKSELYLSTSAVFLTEIVKLIACLLVICIQESSCLRCASMVFDHIVKQPVDTMKVCVPAIIYTLQNNLLYTAVSNLDAATFMVTYQLKILTTALFSVWLLRKPLSWPQWFSLLLLFAGISLVNAQTAGSSPKASELALNLTFTEWPLTSTPPLTFVKPPAAAQSALLGLSAVVVACLLSGFAGIYFEKILKSSHVSVWVRNVQLAMLALPISFFTMMTTDGAAVRKQGILYGYDELVWLIVLVYALGGLTVAVVIKYADNILKGFATSAAIVVSCIASIFLFDFWPTPFFMLGTTLVIGAIFVYSRFPFVNGAV